MTGIQKVIKTFAICLAIFIISTVVLGILSGISLITNVFPYIGFGDNKIVVENFEEVYQDIEKIEIDSSVSNIIVQSGDEFRVEAHNLTNEFSSTVQNGTLKIKEDKKWFINNTNVGEIIVYVPDSNLRQLNIESSVGKVELSDINVDALDIKQGAGTLRIFNFKSNETDIDGGAGTIEVTNSVLDNLDFDAGVGKIEIEAEIKGNSKIDCGVGEIKLLLLGNTDMYNIKAEKGIGSIEIDGEDYNSNTSYGDGTNRLKINGGVGSIKIYFSENGV